jgi:hypothetical protein
VRSWTRPKIYHCSFDLLLFRQHKAVAFPGLSGAQSRVVSSILSVHVVDLPNLWLVLISGQPRYSGVQKVFDHTYLGPRRLGTTVSTVAGWRSIVLGTIEAPPVSASN